MSLRNGVLLSLIAVPALAAAGSWSGNASLGFLRTTGNAKGTTLNFKADADYQTGPWENKTNAQATSASSDGTTTAERYAAGDKLEYNFTDTDYAFGSLAYDNDRFSGILERYAEAIGYGRRLLKTQTQKLDADVGVGANQERLAGDGNGFSNELIGVFDANYRWAISDATTFTQTVHVEAGQRNTFVNPVTELKLTVIGNVFATFDYEVRYNSTVPATRLHTDTITSVNFGYSFGKSG